MVGLVAPVVVGEVIVGGWVVHAHSGERLPGAMVSLFCGRKFPLTSQWTDTEGAFVFRGVPAGRCTLFAALGTHMPRVRLDLRPGERRLLDVPLDPTSKRGDYWTLKYMVDHDAYVTRVPVQVAPEAEVVFGGRVVHARSGAGLAGAVVILRRGREVFEAHADDDGAFAFRGITPGECTLQVLFGAATTTTPLVFGAGERRIIDVPIDPDRKPSITPALRAQSIREGDTIRVPAPRDRAPERAPTRRAPERRADERAPTLAPLERRTDERAPAPAPLGRGADDVRTGGGGR